mgnify:FL=1
MNYEQLLTAADQAGLTVKERPLQKYDGLIRGNRIAIRKNIDTQAKKSCVLAEELGHHYTTTGNILNQSADAMNRKQEYRARLYGYNLRVGLIGIINAYEACCRNLHEMAEYLDVPEDYLTEVIDCFRSKYGQYVAVDNYIIYFIPQLAVIRISTL